jgi:hypothetical protein
MIRALIGAVAGAVAMFVVGFVFFATPLQNLGMGSLNDTQAAAVQQAMNANLPGTGTYYVPGSDTPGQSVLYGKGGVATVHYNSAGFAASDTTTMVGGFVQMLIVNLLMASALYLLAQHVSVFAQQARILILGVLAAGVFMRLGEPVWEHQDWTYSIYLFVADCVAMSIAGLVILKLLPRQAATAAATPAGSTSDL